MQYTVKSGDTLTAISKKYGVSVSAIQNVNRNLIKDVNKIGVGWVLKIPTTTQTKNYAEIGKQFETCINDIKKLPSYKKLVSML